MKEVILICVGQFGVQAGHDFWQMIRKEYHNNPSMFKIRTLFQMTAQNETQLIPNTIFIDSDPLTIDRIKADSQKCNYNYHLCTKQSSASIYSRVSYYVYSGISDDIENSIKTLANKCENLMGFVFLYAPHSAMGSFAGRIAERVSLDFDKKSVVSVCMFPSPDLGNGAMETYNFAGYHNFSDCISMHVCMNNQGIYHSLESQAGLDNVNYSDTNEVVSRVISNLLIESLEERKDDAVSCDLEEIIQSLVPYPRLNYVQCSLTPLITREDLFK